MTDTKVLFEGDLELSALSRKQIVLVGYGSQGRAQALNLRDSGCSPIVAVREGKSRRQAVADGFRPEEMGEAVSRADVVVLLTPDETHSDVCARWVVPNARKGMFLGFATGFGVHFGLVDLPDWLRVFLAAPKGPGPVLRARFEAGGGIPALVASLHDDREELAVAMAYARAIGCGRAGVVRTTFREEAVADLFGEQCVLAGGMVELMKSAFEVLVRRGFTPEVAYIECVSEVEYMASLISRVGIAGLEANISSTAFFGGATRGPRVVDGAVRARLEGMLAEIEDGSFVREFQKYVAGGKPSPVSGADLGGLESARSKFKPGE
ncbi:MAG: ketol-acid reductoisomerase [bacterium]